jgi:H2-forming N5,N10-methylenetetrahydromethanopterin dehydrogenase-like enzyme
MVVKDLQPMSIIVNDSGFRNLIETLDKRYHLPSRSTISMRLSQLYSDIQTKLQLQIDKSSHISLTTDIWTSIQTKSLQHTVSLKNGI